MNKLLRSGIFVLAVTLGNELSVIAQQVNAPVLTANDYGRAEKMMAYNTNSLMDYAIVRPNWINNNQFWYRVLTPQGSRFVLVDAVKKTRNAAFNQEKLAASLSLASGKTYQANRLPFQDFSFSADQKAIFFMADGKQWKCNLTNYQCIPDNSPVKKISKNEGVQQASGKEIISPDGTQAAFIRDYNLWIRNVKTNQQTQLTTDGVKDYGYATDNAGWKQSENPVLLWSPDSKKIGTFKQDQRKVSDMYLVSTNVGKPTLKTWKYPLPGDTAIAMIERVIINVDPPKVIRLQIPPDPHRATLSDDISSSGTFDDVDWNADATQLAFVSTSRDHKEEKVRIANAETGAVREVFEEKVPTQFESGQGSINWRYLAKSNEIIWYSERDNWGHLYLYNALTGKLKNQITKGDWVVTKLLNVDEKKRELYFIADGLEAENPYFSQLCKIGFDGKHFTVLTPEAGNHQITFSPGNNYFIDSYSKPNVPPVTVLCNLEGKILVNLEKADVSRLIASGWHAPVPITVIAHDGKTDLYGLMFTPSNLQAQKKYPVVDYIYPGPQGGSVGSWSFAASRGDNQALAELGFIVVEIEGTSNPLRSKSFHDMSYGNMSENTLPDQVSGIQQLAQKYPYLDLNRVGIWGHSGGGFATAAAMFRYPDFFKVGISESGNHDNRNYEDDWGERYDGLAANSDYAAHANETYAKNLKGKLMLAHGLMDDNVPPSNTMLVVNALIKANKDFDLVVFPNSRHGYGEFSNYMTRRRWDYFVRYLQGAIPPQQYELKSKADPRNSVQ